MSNTAADPQFKPTVSEESLKLIAGDILKHVPKWFTRNQLAKFYNGNSDQADVAIGELEFNGFIVSDTVDGSWKHRIIQSPTERLAVIDKNLKSVKETLLNHLECKNHLELLRESVSKEI